MTKLLLVEIGTDLAALPDASDPLPPAPSTWTPPPMSGPSLPTPLGLHAQPVVDGVCITWVPPSLAGTQSVVQDAADASGVPGAFADLATTGSATYLVSLPDGPRWVRVLSVRNGIRSAPTAAVLATPLSGSGMVDDVADLLAKDLLHDQQIAQEIIDRQTADAQTNIEMAVLRAQVGDILEADEWNDTTAYPAGDLVQSGGKLYRALQAVPAGTLLTDTAYWESLGNYASLGEAVSATAAQVVVHTAEIAQLDGNLTAVSQTVSQHAARMPAGSGELSTDARVTTVEQASVSRDDALSARTTTMENRMPIGTGELATTSGLNSLSGRVDATETGIQANSDAITAIGAELAGIESDISRVRNPSFEEDGGWTLAVGAAYYRPSSANDRVNSGSSSVVFSPDPTSTRTTHNTLLTPAAAGERFVARVRVRNYGATAGAGIRAGIRCFSGSGAYITTLVTGDYVSDGGGAFYFPLGGVAELPTGTAWIAAAIYTYGTAIAAGEFYVDDFELYRESQESHAAATAISSLDARVSATEGGIIANSTAITQVSSRVGQAADNLVLTQNFDDGTRGTWAAGTIGQAGNPLRNILRITEADSYVYENGGNQWIACSAGDVFDLSAVLRSAQLRCNFYDAAKQYLGTGGANIQAPSYSEGVTGSGVAPANTAWMRIAFRYPVEMYPGEPLSYGRNFIVRRRSASEVQSATVTQSLTTSVNSVTGKFNAAVTNVLDVNGNISGTKSENDGTTSKFSILATIFRVISGGAAGMEWQNGYIRIWKGASQLVLGNSFGASGDLILWYGPNIAVNTLTKANGTIWFDTASGAYFGGTLSAGVLKNAATSSQVSGTAQVETGSFGTNGNQKVVVYSLSYNNSSNEPTDLGEGALSATIVLERSYSNGAWTQVGTLNISGNRTTAAFEPGVGYHTTWTLNGSSTFTDNLAGTGTFNYRVRVTAPSGWPYVAASGSGTQRLSVTSTEQ